MAEQPISVTEVTDQFRAQGEQLAIGATEPVPLSRTANMLLGVARDVVTFVVEYGLKISSTVAVWFAKRVMAAEDRADSSFRDLTRAAIQDLTGADPGAGHGAVGRTLMQSLSGGPGAVSGNELVPSTAGAEAYMEMVMKLALEGYIEGGITSALSIGFLDKFTELDDILANVLGLGRMSRAVMRPLMTARVITPMQWHVNKQYRPELLAPGELARQVARGRMTREAALEEMARQGWSDSRAEALFSNAAKFFSVADAYLSWRAGMWSRDEAAQHLRDQGFTLEQAEHALTLQRARDVVAFEEQLANVGVAAYADRRISRAHLSELVRGALKDQDAASRILELADARLSVNVHPLTSAEVRRLAKGGILAPIDYRRALEREGRTPEAIVALDLELRAELADKRADDALREQAAAERAVEQLRRDQERQAREADLAIRKSRVYASLAEARRFYVRGLVPLDAYRRALEGEGLPNLDIDAYLADATAERDEQLEQEERRRELALRDTTPTVSIAQLEDAVLRGILTLDRFAIDLAARGFDQAEVGVFVALLRARLDERDAAAAKRREAEERSRLAGVSLDDFERAVRLGLRTRAQFSSHLEALGLPETARALILDLLEAQIAADAKARVAGEAAATAAATNQISLEQRWRAVVRGVRPIAYVEEALIAARTPTDDMLALLDLLRLEAAEAAAARERRAAMPVDDGGAELTLAQWERAVKFGILPPDALRDELRRRGFDEADIELALALVVADVPDVVAGEQLHNQVAAELRARGLSLAQQEELVTRGIRTLAEHGAWLTAQGYGEDAAALLVQLLEERIAADLDGLRTRISAKLGKAEGAPAIGELEAALDAGELAPLELRDILVHFGAGRDESLVYARLRALLGAEAA